MARLQCLPLHLSRHSISLASGTRPDRGRLGSKPCWPGDKKTGEAAATGPARPGLAAVGPGPKLRKKSKKHKWSAWPGQALAGRGQNWQSLARKSRNVWPTIGLHRPQLVGAKNWSSLPRNLDQPVQDQITGHACLFRVYLEWSVL